ncbi:MAG: hypothetical protein AB1714_26890 [Acidobacteriota bacterium]
MAGVFYAVVLFVLARPLIVSGRDSLIGEGGDAFLYLWSNWWFGESMARGGLSIYQCPLVLHPFGADLVQADFPLWPNFLAWTLGESGFSLVEAYNITALAAFWLNAMCAFLLAFALVGSEDEGETRILGRFIAALAGGAAFAFAPYFWSRLRGHFTLLHAYPLPLLALSLSKARVKNSRSWYLGVGFSLVWAALCNYSYFIYASIYLGLFLLYDSLSLEFALARRLSSPRAVYRLLAAAGALALAMAVYIGVSGGGEIEILGARIRMRSTANPLIAWWTSWLIALALKYRVNIRFRLAPAFSTRRLLRLAKWASLPLLILLPLMIQAVSVVWAGDFAGQQVGWKTGPDGAYPLALFVPNIYHALWGPFLCESFESWDLMEGFSIGLCLASLLLVVLTRSWKGSGWWGFSLLWSTILSLGPFLRLLPGFEHGPVLPFWLLRYVPIVSGARIPCRWIVIALLAWAVLVARGVLALKTNRARVAVLLILLFETCFVTIRSRPAVTPDDYQVPADHRSTGALLELPFGVADGRRGWGPQFPPELLYYQTAHHRPLVGGYLSRIPDRVFGSYQEQPVIAAFVAAQEGTARGIPRGEFADLCERWNIEWVIVDKHRASARLVLLISELAGPAEQESDRRIVFKIGSASE